MKKHMRLRSAIAREAARLMYEEGVGQYLDAKHLGAKRVLGRDGARTLRHRPRFLPSNGEIREALLELAELTEGAERSERLFAMRVVALEHMRALEGFDPRLIGSVRSGHVRRGSDIDLHVFTNDVEVLEQRVHALGWVYELDVVTLRVGQGFQEYLHLHVEALFPVELSVYERRERRIASRSSTDGKRIERTKPEALEALLASEHPEAWEAYQRCGELEDRERWWDDGAFLTLADVEGLASPW